MLDRYNPCLFSNLKSCKQSTPLKYQVGILLAIENYSRFTLDWVINAVILILTCLQNMLKNASCLCGHFVENAEHFFFHCAKYTNQRIKLFQDLQHIHPLNLNTLLFDSSEHNTEVNTHSFVCTQEFLYSKRFGSICSLFSQYFLSSPCPSQSTSFLK